MSQYPFVWLGSKRAQKNRVPEKGWRLDRATQAGLPVPNGGILLDDFFWLGVQEQVVQWQDGRAHIPHPQALSDLLYTTVRFPRLEKPCAVRALFGPAVTAVPPSLDIDVTDAAALTAALNRLWAAIPAPVESRHDILIQEMVAVEISGTAVSSPQAPTNTINHDGQTQLLPALGWRDKPDSALPPAYQRLQRLLRGLRRTWRKEAWQISWADDGRVCWLLQVQGLPR